MRKTFAMLMLAGVMAAGATGFAHAKEGHGKKGHDKGEQKAMVGQMAPAFTLPDPEGKPYTLADQKGKWVVLEWFNAGCPFVEKHYSGGNMQKLQETYTAKGVTWFSVLSSAPGKEGFVAGPEARAQQTELKSKATALLLDPAGNVGKAYGSKNTPTMVIINPEGKIVYYGAIDSKATTDAADIATSTNYVSQALDEAMAGKPVSVSYAKPYGCGVKY